MKKRLIALLLLLAMMLPACSEAPDDESSETENTAVNASTETNVAEDEAETHYKDNVPEGLKYDGATFDIATREVGHMNYLMNVEDITGESINDAIYNRNRSVEDRFNITITEITNTDTEAPRVAVSAGDDTYEMIKTRGPMAIVFLQQNLLYIVTDIPYIDLTQPYWDQNLNEALTIGEKQFIVSGALSVTEYDYTSALLFNKQMISDFGLDMPYDIVHEGKWTQDVMNEMMVKVVSDVNGDGAMTESDRYGYLASPKHVLPSFLLAAGQLSVTKNELDIPGLSMETEPYFNTFTKIFEITRDNGAWFVNSSGDNVSVQSIQMFSENKALFMDAVMFYLEQLREMDSDFGVIPYPKYDEAQSEYYSRTSWVEPFVVPTTNLKLEMIGAVIEALCCESANTVIPAYYEASLKGKISRDEDSREMLDLIFATRIIDFGDTVWVDVVRDGVLSSMYSDNNRNLSSRIKTMSKQIKGKMKKLEDAIPNWDQGS